MATVWEGTYLSLQIIVPSSKEKQLDPENHPFFHGFTRLPSPSRLPGSMWKFTRGSIIQSHFLSEGTVPGSIPIGSMVLLYMVTFTINIPQMLAYIYHTWILWDRDGLINSPWGPIPCSRATTHGWVKRSPRRRSTGHFPPVQKKAKDEANDPSWC